MFTEQMKEGLGLAGTPIHPRSANGAVSTGVVDMSKFNRVMFLGEIGTLGTDAVLQGYVQGTNESGGGNSVNISGLAITNINTANQAFTVECRSDQLTYRYIKMVLNVNVASVVSCFPIVSHPRYHPSTGSDDASIAQRVAL